VELYLHYPIGLLGGVLNKYQRQLYILPVRVWTGFIWLRKGPVAGCCEHGNEPLSSIKCGEFLG
jgi:hypothetical protein